MTAETRSEELDDERVENEAAELVGHITKQIKYRTQGKQMNIDSDQSEVRIQELAAEAMVLAVLSGLSLSEAAVAFGTASKLLATLKANESGCDAERFETETVRCFAEGIRELVAVHGTVMH